VACVVGREVSSVDHGVLAMTISLPMVWRLVLGLDWCDARGDTILSGLAFGVDTTADCIRTSSMRCEAEGEDGWSEGPDGDRDHDLETWLDIFEVC
jgi:hypothetical protein